MRVEGERFCCRDRVQPLHVLGVEPDAAGFDSRSQEQVVTSPYASQNATARVLASLLALAVFASTTRSIASPADVFSSSAPAIGSDSPKAAELRT